jgi:hypothetical protein
VVVDEAEVVAAAVDREADAGLEEPAGPDLDADPEDLAADVGLEAPGVVVARAAVVVVEAASAGPEAAVGPGAQAVDEDRAARAAVVGRAGRAEALVAGAAAPR